MKNLTHNFFITKKSPLILVMLLSITSYAQLQFDYEYTNIEPVTFQATYILKYMKDTTNQEFINNTDMLLFIGNETSLFLGKENYIADTIMRGITNVNEFQNFLSDRNKPIPRFNYFIYKNYPHGKLTYIEHIIDGTFKFEEDLDLFKWNLEGDTATIGGYKAQKATCDFGGRSWVAWFSPEIPYNDGPYKFNGLPGLIVKIGDTREHYVFELISIKKPEKGIMIDMKEEEYIEASKQDFFRAKDAFYADIIYRAKEAGLSSKSQQTAAKNAAKKNNPIELKRK